MPNKKIIFTIGGVVLILAFILVADIINRNSSLNKIKEKERIKKLEHIADSTLLTKNVYEVAGFVAWLNAKLNGNNNNVRIDNNYCQKISPDNEVTFTTSEIKLERPHESAFNDLKYGLALSYYYYFKFSSKDVLLNSNLVVTYLSDSVIFYPITFSPLDVYFNQEMTKPIYFKWKNERELLEKKKAIAERKALLKRNKEAQIKEAQQLKAQKKYEKDHNNGQNSNFAESYFKFSCSSYDIESGGDITTVNEISYHTIDLKRGIVTMKSKSGNNWVELKYPISGSYKQGLTYVLEVNNLGLKEFWFQPSVPNLGYDFDDGTRIACYGIRTISVK
jgi:hypothetical protein